VTNVNATDVMLDIRPAEQPHLDRIFYRTGESRKEVMSSSMSMMINMIN
jgi:hypothetical protein